MSQIHGGQMRQIAARFGIPAAHLLDFSANINPDGPPPALLSTLHACLDDVSILTSYPDLEETVLKQSIAACAGVRPQEIAVANGFVPLLECALRTLKIKRCLLPVPAFVEYRRSLAQAGVAIQPHLLDPGRDFRYDIDPLTHGDHDAILLANPQNPSGVLTGKDRLLQLIAQCAERQIAVLLDEAFIDYAPLHSLIVEVSRWPNLIVFRSVTKFHAIPGLRVAYAAANQAITHLLNKNLPPWPITTLASRAVVSALEDRAYAEHARVQNERRRSRLQAGLEALGIRAYPSAANFLLLRLPHGVSSTAFWTRLIVGHRIVLRDCSNYEALPAGHLRTAVRGEQDSQQLVQAIADLL